MGRKNHLKLPALEDPLHAVDFSGPLLHQLRPVPGQVASVTLALGRNETRLEQAIAHQCGKPARIGFVRLPAWDVLHVGGIHEDDGKRAF